MSIATHIPLRHAVEYLRQHFAVAAGLEPMDYRPLGSNPTDDPEVQECWREVMDRCCERARAELAGCIAGAKIPVWGTQKDGSLAIVAPDWAAKRFEDENRLGVYGLYVARTDFTELVRLIAPESSRHYLSEDYGSPKGKAPMVRPKAEIIQWEDFPSEALPELKQFADEAPRDEWWTWPEAIAWVGGRDYRNIATLRYWGKWWTRRTGSFDIIGAQHDIARQFCESVSQAEVELINAIERGAVKSLGRKARNLKASLLPAEVWRGGMIRFSERTAQLVSAEDSHAVWAFDVAVNRADLVDCFQMSALEDLQPSKDLRTAPTLPSDDAIREKMQELKNTGLSRDDAAKHIRSIPGFESVGNELARRAVAGTLTRGRPKKRGKN